MKEKSITEAFEAMRKAYEKLLREADAFAAEQRERRMDLPPTLGHKTTDHE